MLQVDNGELAKVMQGLKTVDICLRSLCLPSSLHPALQTKEEMLQC